MEITFTIPGAVVGKGRPRFSSVGSYVKAYTPAKTASYENLVKLMYQEAAQGKRFEDDEPLCMTVEAFYDVPKSTPKKKAEKMLADEIRPTKKPDLDNVLKIIADALNTVAYRDDTQLIAATITKRYSLTPCVIVTIKSWGIPEKE